MFDVSNVLIKNKQKHRKQNENIKNIFLGNQKHDVIVRYACWPTRPERKHLYLARKQACSPLNIFCSYVSLLKSKADYDISQKLATLTKKRSLRSLSKKELCYHKRIFKFLSRKGMIIRKRIFKSQIYNL